MRNLPLIIVVLVLGLCLELVETGWLRNSDGIPPEHTKHEPWGETDFFGAALADHQSGSQITGEGVVTKLLPDDTEGSRHQRFILTLPTGKTLLVAHNIDLAPRLNLLELGDTVEFNGVYEWNSQGGVIHWTHHDPSGRHPGGWLKLDGLIFE